MQNCPLLVIFFVASVVASNTLLAQVPPPNPVSPPDNSLSPIHKRVIPLPPSDLLKLLPAAPAQWQLKQSTAKNFFMEWVTSQAQREFNYTLPPSTDTPPAPIQVLRFTITDTGYYTGLMNDLLSTQAPKSGEAEVLMLSSYPARRIMVNKTQERLRVLVRGRYVVQIDVQNEPPGSAQKWWAVFDQTKLAALPIDGDETLPRPFSIVRIDELNPQNNSTAKANFTTQEEADKSFKRH